MFGISREARCDGPGKLTRAMEITWVRARRVRSHGRCSLHCGEARPTQDHRDGAGGGGLCRRVGRPGVALRRREEPACIAAEREAHRPRRELSKGALPGKWRRARGRVQGLAHATKRAVHVFALGLGVKSDRVPLPYAYRSVRPQRGVGARERFAEDIAARVGEPSVKRGLGSKHDPRALVRRFGAHEDTRGPFALRGELAARAFAHSRGNARPALRELLERREIGGRGEGGCGRDGRGGSSSGRGSRRQGAACGARGMGAAGDAHAWTTSSAGTRRRASPQARGLRRRGELHSVSRGLLRLVRSIRSVGLVGLFRLFRLVGGGPLFRRDPCGRLLGTRRRGR